MNEKHDNIRDFFKRNPHEKQNEAKGDGISSYGKKELLERYNIDYDNDDDYSLIGKISEEKE